MSHATSHVIALSGGVGGAKLAFGLAQILSPDDLTIVVNTGDDFEHLGLAISPDIDTVTYTLAGLADRQKGWGLAGETWSFLDALRRLDGEDWFQLGDRDLATHLERTRRRAAGESLSEITLALSRKLGCAHRIVPMSDQPVRTWVDTAQGALPFQQYFVRERCAPMVSRVRFEAAGDARPSPAFAEALARPDLAAIVVCPSNPYLSIDPILSIQGVPQSIRAAAAPCVAISPIVRGQAIKGPTAKLMWELGLKPGTGAVAAHYAGLIDGLILDSADAADADEVERQGLAAHVTATVMHNDEDRRALARAALDFARTIGARRGARAG